MHASADRAASGDRPDPLTARDQLIETIVGQIRRQGYYVAHLDPHPEQDIIDMHWAAQMARRALGDRTRSYTSVIGAQQPGKITIVVAPAATVAADIEGSEPERAAFEELLFAHQLLQDGPATA